MVILVSTCLLCPSHVHLTTAAQDFHHVPVKHEACHCPCLLFPVPGAASTQCSTVCVLCSLGAQLQCADSLGGKSPSLSLALLGVPGHWWEL